MLLRHYIGLPNALRLPSIACRHRALGFLFARFVKANSRETLTAIEVASTHEGTQRKMRGLPMDLCRPPVGLLIR